MASPTLTTGGRGAAPARGIRNLKPDAPGRRRSLGRHLQRPRAWFALPAAALLVIFFAYPLVTSLWQSFFATSGVIATRRSPAAVSRNAPTVIAIVHAPLDRSRHRSAATGAWRLRRPGAG